MYNNSRGCPEGISCLFDNILTDTSREACCHSLFPGKAARRLWTGPATGTHGHAMHRQSVRTIFSSVSLELLSEKKNSYHGGGSIESDLRSEHNKTEKNRPRLVQRRTALRGQGIGAARPPARTVRRHTEDDLNERDPEIPYVKAESACRNLVCALMERQDRMNVELLERIVDLQYRMDDLEGDFSERKEENHAARGEAPA